MACLAIGLMSGTSADGIDAALVRLEGTGTDTRVEMVAFEGLAYPPDLRREVLAVSGPAEGTVDRLCRLHAVLGEWFAQAALKACRAGGVRPEEVAFIGSHGQTVHHLPDPVTAFGTTTRSTLQIGNPAVIAERTGITTVSDFRSRDVAAGGSGAPLVPLVDYLLFGSPEAGRIMLNVGGIANITVLSKGAEARQVSAFDTGPGNMVVDGLVSALTGGRETFDRDGRLAAAGTVREDLLKGWMAHPYFGAAPPKSTGREAFGEPFVRRALEDRSGASDADLLRTATELTARSVAHAIEAFVLPGGPVDELFVSGGGARNPVLMSALSRCLPELSVRVVDALGVGADSKEAVAFAVLANETLAGRPGNLPSATGADRPVVLGSVTPGRGFFAVDRRNTFS